MVFFHSFGWEVSLCCSVIASGGNNFPPCSKSMPGKERSVIRAALHIVDFQPKKSASGSSFNW